MLRPSRQQRLNHAAGGATGTDQQHTQAFQRQPGVDLDIAHQSLAVGVVTEQAAVLATQDGVDRTGALGRRGMFIHQRPGLLLEWHGHIDATALAQKVAHRADKVVEWRQQLAVLQLLTGLLGEHGVNQRRFAVLDRVADNGVTVHQASPASQSRGVR